MSAAAALRSLPKTTSRRGLESSDAALISASRAGDSRAFEELYRRYRAGVRDLCQRMLGDTAKAEDLTQETFIRAYLRMERFQEGKSLWPWLSTIAHHLCIDEIRGRRRAPIASEEAEAETETNLAGDLTSDEAIARHERAQLRARLSSALATLQPSDRRVVFLRSVEEWTYEDIARADGRTVDAIRNAAWRARTTLRNILDTERERTVSALGIISALSPMRALLGRVRSRITFMSGHADLVKPLTAVGECLVFVYLGIASLTFLFASHDLQHMPEISVNRGSLDVTPEMIDKPDGGARLAGRERLDSRLGMTNRRLTPHHNPPIKFSVKQKPPHSGAPLSSHTDVELIIDYTAPTGNHVQYKQNTGLKCDNVGIPLQPSDSIRTTC